MKKERDVWGEFWDRQTFHPESLVKRELKTSSYHLLRKIVQENLGEINDLRTLELGSGLGMNSLLLALKGSHPTLLDTDELALAKARKLYEYYNLKPDIIQADMFTYPGKHLVEKFDLVMSFGVVEHFRGDKRREAVKTHLDLVKKGGLVVVSVPNRYCPTYQLWMNLLKLAGKWSAGYEEPFTRKELMEISQSLNLKNPEVHGLSFLRSVDDHLLFFLKYPLQLVIQRGSFILPLFQVIPEISVPFADSRWGYALWLVFKG